MGGEWEGRGRIPETRRAIYTWACFGVIGLDYDVDLCEVGAHERRVQRRRIDVHEHNHDDIFRNQRKYRGEGEGGERERGMEGWRDGGMEGLKGYHSPRVSSWRGTGDRMGRERGRLTRGT